MNPYVVAKSKDPYGRDAHLFRPERWLPATASEVDRVKRMERLDFAFLFGPRTCLGKGIAAMEIRKSIVEVRDFLMITLRLGGTLTVRLAGPEFRLRTSESSRPPLGCEGTWRILHPQEYVGEGFRKKQIFRRFLVVLERGIRCGDGTGHALKSPRAPNLLLLWARPINFSLVEDDLLARRTGIVTCDRVLVPLGKEEPSLRKVDRDSYFSGSTTTTTTRH